ncbi:DNA breaking-rejoining enzyme, partial [Mycena haematopus]
CDVVDLNGQRYTSDQPRASFGYAQKMRAALKHYFGTVLGLGRLPWKQDAVSSKWTGNPIVSDVLDDYMPSLRRRKVAEGETCQSSRSMTDEILRQSYDYCTTLSEDAKTWCHINQLLQLHCMNTLGFHCMLRSAELVNIQMEDIQFLYDAKGNPIAKLKLRTRKTSQFGLGLRPYTLHLLPDYLAHLDPLRALVYYVNACGITTGFLFRNLNSMGQITLVEKHITTRKYLGILQRHFMDIGVDPVGFGTHLLRRGGVQYHLKRGVNIPSICLWGGWSLDFSLSSVWRYIASLVDEENFDRDNFLNFKHIDPARCPLCGRNCVH